MCTSCSGSDVRSAYSPGEMPDLGVEAPAVRAHWERLGLTGLIDVHTHFMPANVLDKVWAYFDAAGPKVGRKWPITYRLPEEERVERLREFGVRAYSSMLYPHRSEMASWLNAWSADFANRHPDCLHTATLFPEPEVGDYVRHALQAGAQVFKSHIQVGEYDPGDRLLDPAWGALTDAGVPTVIHCGGGPVPGTFTGPGPVRALLERFPKLPLIIAHMGMPEYSEFMDLAVEFENVYLDTTMAFTPFTEEFLPFPSSGRNRLSDLGEKILFGTDFPNIPYPYITQLDSLVELDLGDGWLRAVLHDNAARLFAIAADD